MVHLVIVALRAVAGETESLVGQQLLGASVNSGTDSNAAKKRVSKEKLSRFQIRPKGVVGRKFGLMQGRMERASGTRQIHTQEQCLYVKRIVRYHPFVGIST
jgi:hypothetical protein